MASKYTKELLEEAVQNSTSVAGVLRYLGLRQAGGTQSYIGRAIKKFEIDTSHFGGQAHNRGKVSPNRKRPQDILVRLPKGSPRTRRSQLLRALLESDVKYVCACGVGDMWNGRPITLEINHIDGDFLNNLISNLEFLCPNCHSQETHSNMPWKYRDAE